MAVEAFWSTASSSMAKTSEPVSLSSRSKSLAASSWTVLSSESASDRGTSTSKSVSSKMSFSPFLTAGGGVAASDGLGFDGLAGAAWPTLARPVVWISSSERGASSIESACPSRGRPGLEVDPRVAGPGEVDARRALGSDAVTSESLGLGQRGGLELVAGVEGAQLEIAARVGLKGVDQLARGVQLEVAVRRGGRDLGRRAQKRAGPHRRVARAAGADDAVIGRVVLDQGHVGVARLLASSGEASWTSESLAPLTLSGTSRTSESLGRLARRRGADDHRARAGHRVRAAAVRSSSRMS